MSIDEARFRNPANEAPGWVSPVIDAWVESDSRAPLVVELDGDRVGYIEPIIPDLIEIGLDVLNPIQGEPTQDPAFGIQALWIEEGLATLYEDYDLRDDGTIACSLPAKKSGPYMAASSSSP